jgi:hypothetical protein
MADIQDMCVLGLLVVVAAAVVVAVKGLEPVVVVVEDTDNVLQEGKDHPVMMVVDLVFAVAVEVVLVDLAMHTDLMVQDE